MLHCVRDEKNISFLLKGKWSNIAALVISTTVAKPHSRVLFRGPKPWAGTSLQMTLRAGGSLHCNKKIDLIMYLTNATALPSHIVFFVVFVYKRRLSEDTL